MDENNQETCPNVQNLGNIKEAVCIDGLRIYDSCSDKDCLEDLRVYFPPDKKASAKPKANANKNKANKNKAKAKANANKGKAKSNKNKAKNMNNRNSCDCCNCCQNCGNNSNNSGKILNNIQNSTPQMDADSWKLNGEAQI